MCDCLDEAETDDGVMCINRRWTCCGTVRRSVRQRLRFVREHSVSGLSFVGVLFLYP